MFGFKRKKNKKRSAFFQRVEELQLSLDLIEEKQVPRVTKHILNKLTRQGIEVLVKTNKDAELIYEYIREISPENRAIALKQLAAVARVS